MYEKQNCVLIKSREIKEDFIKEVYQTRIQGERLGILCYTQYACVTYIYINPTYKLLRLFNLFFVPYLETTWKNSKVD